jgi:hypothetical protein
MLTERGSTMVGRSLTTRAESARSFLVGALVGALILVAIGTLIPVRADHLSGSCGYTFWSEITKENNNFAEDGTKGEIKVNYPDGGPASDGALVRSVFAFLNADNFAEAGWNWRDCCHSSPRRFWARRDSGQYGEDANDGDGGTRGNYQDYKVDNDHGTTWLAFKDGDQYHSYTFNSLDHGKPLANSEVDKRCDSAEAYFRTLKDKQNNTGNYDAWEDQRQAGLGIDNPCYVVDIISNTAMDVNHSNC